MKVERANEVCYRVISADGRLVALAMKLTDGRWGAFDVDGQKPLTKRRFIKPKEVRDWLATMGANT